MARKRTSREKNEERINMTRKLVVTVFAISLSVFGCGSDDGDTKDGSADVIKLDVAPKLDTAVKTDTVAPSDTIVKIDGSSDGMKAEVSTDVPVMMDGSDAAKDGGAIDVPLGQDVPQDDTAVAPGADAGSDGGSAG
jgi:hypothetical protein